MKRWLAASLILLAGCAPTVQGDGLVLRGLDADAYEELAAKFAPALAARGVSVERAAVYEYDGSAPDAFERVTRHFYARYPGFCPAVNGFVARGDEPIYITLAVRGAQVRGFLYDQRARPKLKVAFLEGSSTEPLPRGGCPPLAIP